MLPCAMVLSLAAAGLHAQTSQQPPLPGEIPMPYTQEPAKKNRFFVTGLKLTGNFDDNALNASLDKQYALVGVIEPHLGWTLPGHRYNWLFDYDFGFAASSPVSVYDSQSHRLDSTLEFQLTQRWKFRLRDRFQQSKDSFSGLLTPESATGFGVLDRPNDSILTPAVRRSTEQAGVDISYAVGPHSLAAVSGSFFQVRYGALPASQAAPVLENSSSTIGHAVYLHHLSRAYWAGLEYSTMKLTVQSLQSPVFVNSAFLTQTVSLTSRSTVTLFAGPEYFTLLGKVHAIAGATMGPASVWQWSGGVDYAMTRSRATFVAGGFHKISDGGGLLGAVRVSSASTRLRYRLSSNWTASVMAMYERNQPIVSPLGPLSYGSGVAGLSRRLTPNVSMDFYYGREYLPLSTQLAKFASHDRATVSLAYEVKNPIGR